MKDRIPSLDGIRALSICCVLLAHLCGTPGFLPASTLRFTGDLGNLGVRIFFVISGFLITGLLLKEQRSGAISLKRFYIRRTLRIFPAAFLFIGVAALLFPLRTGDLLHALTYTSNYHPAHAWTFGHLWSLSVEEQFYLLWPAVMVLFGLRGATSAALLAVLAAPVLRTVGYFSLGMTNEMVGQEFQFAMDAIAAGCLLALLRTRLAQEPRYLRLLRSHWVLLLVPAMPILNLAGLYPRAWLPVGETLVNLSAAVLIDRFVRFPPALLEHPLLVWIGVRSYSLYLWQQVFLNRTGGAWYNAFPLNIALAVLAATVSYAWVERPFLALRKVFEGRARPAAVAVPPLALDPLEEPGGAVGAG